VEKTSRPILLLVLVAAVLVPTRPASGAFPGANGVIAYTAVRGDQSDICIVDPGGMDPRVLVGGPAHQAEPAWAADGSKLAYSEVDETGIPHIKVLDLRTGTTTDLGSGFQPAWSPDGTRLA
jgi:Tol biopolymer transport system component